MEEIIVVEEIIVASSVYLGRHGKGQVGYTPIPSTALRKFERREMQSAAL